MRRGFASLWVIALLGLMAVLIAATFDHHLSNRRSLELRKRQAQADLVVQSGLELAISQLLKKTDYAGETKEVTPDFKVAVVVKSLGNNQYEVNAKAEPLEKGSQGLHRSKQWRVERVSKGKDVSLVIGH